VSGMIPDASGMSTFAHTNFLSCGAQGVVLARVGTSGARQ